MHHPQYLIFMTENRQGCRAAVCGKAYVRRPMSDPLGVAIRAQLLLELQSKPEVSEEGRSIGHH